MKDFDIKKEIEEVIGIVSNEQLSQLVTLSKKITNYNAKDKDMVNSDLEWKEAEIDENCIAIVSTRKIGMRWMKKIRRF